MFRLYSGPKDRGSLFFHSFQVVPSQLLACFLARVFHSIPKLISRMLLGEASERTKKRVAASARVNAQQQNNGNGWKPAPQPPPLNNHYSNSNSNNSNRSSLVAPLFFLALLLLLLFAAAGVWGWRLVGTLQHSLAEVQDVELASIVRQLESQLAQSERDRRQLSQDLEQQKALSEVREQNNQALRGGTKQDTEPLQNQVQEWQGRAEHWEASTINLRRRIQIASRQKVLHTWGPGPFKLQMELAFDPAEVQDAHLPRTGNLWLELAPLDEMPHTIHYILQAVSQGLYNGTSFHRNAGHVLQAGTAPNFLTSSSSSSKNAQGNVDLMQPFRNAGLEHLYFQEYSEHYPHQPFTIGMAGRPAGPEFYINLQDNTILHGPGGQGNHYRDLEADPCFGKILLESQNLVLRMHQAPVVDQGFKHLLHPVAITGMSIVH